MEAGAGRHESHPGLCQGVWGSLCGTAGTPSAGDCSSVLPCVPSTATTGTGSAIPTSPGTAVQPHVPGQCHRHVPGHCQPHVPGQCQTRKQGTASPMSPGTAVPVPYPKSVPAPPARTPPWQPGGGQSARTPQLSWCDASHRGWVGFIQV